MRHKALLMAGVDGVATDAGVRVHAPGRLHMGFLDPAGTLGRRFGSLGLMVDGWSTVVVLRRAAFDRDSAADAAGQAELPRARGHLELLRLATGFDAPLHLHIAEALPAHAGLGSGTQLALAVGHAFRALSGADLTTAELARITKRGLRSGVGIAGFDQGGLLLDGGPGSDGAAAPVLARIALPPPWRVLVALDPHVRGLSGAAEKAALAALPPLPREAAAEICHEVLMRILPGAATGEFAPFAAGITRVQRLLATHFAPAQQGRGYASAAVGRLIEWIGAHTVAGVGQSSWGPAGFALVPSAGVADATAAAAREAGIVDPAIELRVATPRDRGATLIPID